MAYTIDGINNNATESRNSRYVQGGLTDIYNNRLGWWEKRVLTKDFGNFTFEVLEHEQARPDLISQRLYGKPIYAWLILQYNNIADPETELVIGAIFDAPTQQRLIMDINTKPEGGNIIT